MPNIKYPMGLILSAALLVPTVAVSAAKVKGVRSGQETAVPTGVIFSKVVSERNKLCSLPTTCWSPEPDDIAGLERNLPEYLRKTEDVGAHEISTKLNGYKRKYFGYTKDGQRWISLVGLCSQFWHRTSRNFQTQQRPFTDMGTCYFLLEYNVATGQFAELYIDGDA
jgi:hypothetical protein